MVEMKESKPQQTTEEYIQQLQNKIAVYEQERTISNQLLFNQWMLDAVRVLDNKLSRTTDGINQIMTALEEDSDSEESEEQEEVEEEEEEKPKTGIRKIITGFRKK